VSTARSKRPTLAGQARPGVPASICMVLALAVGLILLQACTVVTAPGPVYVPAPGETVHIPPGHFPPPGKCRIWFPGRPPGHQPPPGDCHELRFQVPPGAMLIYGK
jgi:hypothetical protein